MRASFLASAALAVLIACAKQPPPSSGPARPPIIDAVHFDSGSSRVNGTEMAAIDKAAEVLRTSDWTVLVLGLADATGDPAVNKALSLQRAETVAAELRRKVSVPSDRIVVHAIGERLATGASISERKVEFVFFEPQGLTLKEVVIRSRVLEEDFRRAR
jgi:outer membrane protein OmpA-like peptidoglycan-associated protein